MKVCFAPFDFLKMLVASFRTKADHSILFERRVKEAARAMNQLEIVRCRITRIKQNALCLNSFVCYRSYKHIAKKLVFHFPIGIWSIETIINWKEIFWKSCRMHQIDDANPTNQAVLCAAPLVFH